MKLLNIAYAAVAAVAVSATASIAAPMFGDGTMTAGGQYTTDGGSVDSNSVITLDTGSIGTSTFSESLTALDVSGMDDLVFETGVGLNADDFFTFEVDGTTVTVDVTETVDAVVGGSYWVLGGEGVASAAGYDDVMVSWVLSASNLYENGTYSLSVENPSVYAPDPIPAVPLPASSLLLVGGLGAFGALRRRKNAA